MTGELRALLLSGSTRGASANTAALRTLVELAGEGVAAVLWERLPEVTAFNPDGEPDPAVVDLRRELAASDAVVMCTPEYAGTLPGAFKNVLDWLVGSGELYGKPVAWITVAGPGRGDGAEATLASVLGYVGADILARACVRIPVGSEAVGPDGVVHDADLRGRLAAALRAVAEGVRSRPGR